MSLSKKVAALVLLAAVPNLAQSTQHTDREIEIHVEPNSNFEIMLEHDKGFLDSKNDQVTILENVQEFNEKDGYTLDREEEEEDFECDCDQDGGDEDEDYDADYGQVVVESQVEEGNNEDIECHCHDNDGQDDKADQDYDADYDEIFVETEEEGQEKEHQSGLVDGENENQECHCDKDGGDNDKDYDADFDEIFVETEEEGQEKEHQSGLVDGENENQEGHNEDFECHCHDNDNQGDQADHDDYDADYGQIVVESEEYYVKDEQFEAEKKQSNLRTPAANNQDESGEVTVLVTYDQIMATLSEEEKDIEALTGEPFYKRMVDLILGKETQKELEAHRHYYDGL